MLYDLEIGTVTMSTLIYSAQIVILLVCVYMAWRARAALNGLGRGLMLLMLLLIMRRVDDAFHVLSDVETVILSSVVVIVVFVDVYRIYQARDAYRVYLANRHKRMAELEAMRNQDEKQSGDWDSLVRFGFDMSQSVYHVERPIEVKHD